MSKSKVTVQSSEPVQLEKRTNLPFKFSLVCPKCGGTIETDLSGWHYLSYPVVPGKNKVHFYCGADLGEEYCDHLEDVEVVFEITARIQEG